MLSSNLKRAPPRRRPKRLLAPRAYVQLECPTVPRLRVKPPVCLRYVFRIYDSVLLSPALPPLHRLPPPSLFSFFVAHALVPRSCRRRQRARYELSKSFRCVHWSVHHDVRDVNAAWPQLSAQRLRQCAPRGHDGRMELLQALTSARSR